MNGQLHALALHDGVLDLQNLTFFTDEAWFPLNGHIIAKNNKYGSSINPRQAFEALLPNQIRVWCAITASKIMDPYFLSRLLIQSRMSVTVFGPFLKAL
jgi:hypothetical protein